jgi:hypothetical protein
MSATKTKKTKAPKATKTAKAPRARTTKPAGEAKPKKLSAIEAAAQLLAKGGEPMNTRQMIEAMATKGLWTSPGGKTPHATLHSAILREINEKGKDSRFTKTERGKFTAKAA